MVWLKVITAGLLLGLGAAVLNGLAQAVENTTAKSKEFWKDTFTTSSNNDHVMLDFTSPEAQKHLYTPKELSVNRRDGSVEISGPLHGGSQVLAITSGTLPWNLSDYLYLVADVHNGGTQAATLICRAEDPDYVGWQHFSESVARVGAGETTSVLVFLKRNTSPSEPLKKLFPGMDTLPDGYMTHWSGMDPARVTKIVMAVESSGNDFKLELHKLHATGIRDIAALTAPGFFPFIDLYGQFRHAEWPTKIHSPKDITVRRTAEAAALQASPRPASWDKYGGFKDGPQLNASGNFRVEKYANKWWLVDPDGHLFWSHGVTGVGVSSTGPVQGREKFFAELPARDWSNAGGVNWYLANLKLKYGTGAETTATTLAHERLASWGLNTLASWSDPRVTSLDKTPYTITLSIWAPKLAPYLKLADPYDETFAHSARSVFETEQNSSGKDPWCIGYFIANELEWRSGPDMVNEVLTAPANQPGKQALVKLLRQRHTTIANLNIAWHTTYGSWDSLLAATNKVEFTLALKDFTAFNEELAQRYYQTCETELKRAMPNKLNLGSRFHTVNPIAVRAAAKYCDVVSFNKYNTSIRNLNLPDGLDRPILIGEFHFPAWDRSFAAKADCGRLCEKQRADSYWYYLTGALDNPLIVGTHWFQYLDQPLTGRGDGENFPIGFVDVTDTPYDELIKVTRDLGENLYSRRLHANSAGVGNQTIPATKPAMKEAAKDIEVKLTQNAPLKN